MQEKDLVKNVKTSFRITVTGAGGLTKVWTIDLKQDPPSVTEGPNVCPLFPRRLLAEVASGDRAVDQGRRFHFHCHRGAEAGPGVHARQNEGHLIPSALPSLVPLSFFLTGLINGLTGEGKHRKGPQAAHHPRPEDAQGQALTVMLMSVVQKNKVKGRWVYQMDRL